MPTPRVFEHTVNVLDLITEMHILLDALARYVRTNNSGEVHRSSEMYPPVAVRKGQHLWDITLRQRQGGGVEDVWQFKT